MRLRWHKKSSVESDSQIYNLVEERSYPCLKVCSLFTDYLEIIKVLSPNMTTKTCVFPSTTINSDGDMKINWYKNLDQKQVRIQLNEIVNSNSELPIGITLHSMRCGGAFYRVFESPERRFNFRELMAWCRWEDAKTCCEYLLTKNISNEIDPRQLLRKRQRIQTGISAAADIRVAQAIETFVKTV